MHLDDELIQRRLHDELSAAMATSVGEHLTTCADCRERLERARREELELFELLGRVDHCSPTVTARSIAQRASARRAGWTRWAAAIVLTFGVGGIAYALPGSPVPDWTRAIVERVVSQPDRPTPVSTPEIEEGPTSGIAVPVGRNLVIAFSAQQSEGSMRVTLTDGRDVVVSTRDGVASYTSDIDRLLIGNEGARATFDVQIPREARRVEIRLGSSQILLKEGARITAPSGVDSGGALVLPLRTPPN